MTFSRLQNFSFIDSTEIETHYFDLQQQTTRCSSASSETKETREEGLNFFKYQLLKNS